MDCLNNNTSLTYDTDLGRAYEKILKALEYLKNSDDFYEDGVMESTLSRIINILFNFDFHPVIKILTDKAYERIIRTKSELLFYMNSLMPGKRLLKKLSVFQMWVMQLSYTQNVIKGVTRIYLWTRKKVEQDKMSFSNMDT